jgi:6-phosphogluconolactonase
MTRYRLLVCSSADEQARHCAEQIASAIDQALGQRDRCQIALAGGETPKSAYRLLARQHLAWDRVDVLLGDERWVPPQDPSSNARMLRETLLAAPEPGSQARFHPVPTELADPQAGAAAFAELLETVCPGRPPQLDLVLLGLGDDGHTASLFPGTPAPAVVDRWTTIGEGKGLPRVTLTAPVLSAARKVIILVSGSGKQTALARLLDPDEDPQRTPARLVQPDSEVLVIADQAAAANVCQA